MHVVTIQHSHDKFVLSSRTDIKNCFKTLNRQSTLCLRVPSLALRFHSFPEGISLAKNSFAAEVHVARKIFGNDVDSD